MSIWNCAHNVGGALIGAAIVNYFRLSGWKKWLVLGSTSALIGVAGWFAGPAIYAALKPVITKAIVAGTLMFHSSKEWVLRTLGISQQYINQALRLVNARTIHFTNTCLQRMSNASRYVPVNLIINCIKYGTARSDPQGTRAIMYTVSNFYKNGVRYNLEVLFDWASMTVQHFKYWR